MQYVTDPKTVAFSPLREESLQHFPVVFIPGLRARYLQAFPRKAMHNTRGALGLSTSRTPTGRALESFELGVLSLQIRWTLRTEKGIT